MKLRGKKNLFAQIADVRRQTRLVARRRVSVQSSFVDRFINQ